MFDALIRRWWIVAIRGSVAVAFGVAALLAPKATLTALVSLFGVFALAEAGFAIGVGLTLNWLSLFLEGVFGFVVGLFTVVYPAAAELWFVSLIAGWAFLTGIMELVGCVELSHVIGGAKLFGEWILAASGLLTLGFGALLVAQPDPRAASLVWIVGGYAISSGVLLMALAVNIRAWRPLPPSVLA